MSEYSHLLENYQEPTEKGQKVPYTLWGRIARVRGPNGEDQRIPDLAELRLIGSHNHPEKIVQYTGFGWKLLKYWIPELKKFNDVRGLLESLRASARGLELEKLLEEERAKNKVLEAKTKAKEAKNDSKD